MKLLINSLEKRLKGLSLMALSVFTAVSAFAQMVTDTYTTEGNHTWTVPAGITSITVEAWGAGGGGGGTLSQLLPYSNPRAGGGGGGAYSQVQLTVAPGDVINLQVGFAGIGGNSNNDGTAGGASSADILGSTVISADGGQGGSFRTSNDAVGTATGLGGTSGIGFMFAGGNGGPNNSTSNGSGGGGAGGTTQAGTNGTTTAAGIGGTVGGGNGGDPTTTNDQNGNAGIAPGGGGSGSRRTLLQGSNQGGNGARGEIRITYCLVPVQPDIIAGEDALCEGTVQNYSVTQDPNATSYNWTLPSDWSGSSVTNTIGVMAGGASGDIIVEAVNVCGVSTPQTLTITTTPLPVQPSVVSGGTSMCVGTTGTFSVVNDPSVDAYTWTVPSGWTGTSTTNTIDVTAAANNGAITVTSENACGTSPVRILNVTTADVPVQPVTITGNTTFCQGETAAYSVVINPLASGYVWNFPADWTGTSTSNSINLTVGATSGPVSVAAVNQCGTSTAQTINVTVNQVTNGVTQSGATLTADQEDAVYQWLDCGTGNPIPGATTRTYTPTQNGEYSVLIITSANCTVVSECATVSNLGIDKEQLTSLSIYPNPASDNVTISNIPAESTVRLLDMTGKVLFSTAANSTLSMDLTDIKAGVYLLSIEGKKGSKTQKLVVRK